MMKKRLAIWSVLFCVTSLVKANFFVARKYQEKNYLCITNTSFALSWNDPAVNETLQEVSKFTPKPKQRDFDCEITNDNKTRLFAMDPWNLRSSFDELILDERWEAMETIQTNFVSGSGMKQLMFKNVLNITTQNFDISLSIRTQREAHIFLCDGKNVSQSNCYWLLLEAFSGNESAIRKCPQRSIPSINHKWATEPCKTPLVNISHPTVPRYLSSKQWNHFIISKRDKTLLFKKANTHQTDPLLNLGDTEGPIDIKHMIVHSKQVNALWKIHKLDYLYTNSVSSWTKIGPAIDVEEDSICISMYVSMCSSCQLKLGLARGYNARDKVINERTYRTSEQSGWFKIKYIADNLQQINEKKVKLAVSTVNSNQNGLWRIDNIRLCKKEEFRMIGLSEKASCQMMSNNNDIIDFKEETQVSVFKNHCPEDTIGSFCMRCNLTFEDCKNIKICTKNECTCSAGYQGMNCYSECKIGYYGHDCNKQCGKCQDTCNNINGTCTSCKEGYTGPKCDIPTTKIFKLKATARSSTTIKLEWTPPQNSYGTFKSYLIKYKHVAYMGCKNESRPSPPENKEVIGTSLILRELIPFSEYNVTISARNSKFELNESLMVTTDPEDEIGPEETPKIFSITKREIEAKIELSRNCEKFRGPLILNISSVCTSPWCAEQNRVPKVLQSNNTKFFSLKELIPFSDYTVEVKYCRYGSCSESHKGTFTTKPTVPGKVKDLLIYTKNSTSVSLRWEPPYPPTGIFKQYKIGLEYLPKSSEHFKEKNLSYNITRCKLWPNLHCAILSNLQKASYYTIKVFSQNKEPSGYGEPEIITAYTKTEPSQAPYDLYARWSPKNELNLEWKHPNQTNGDIQYFGIVIACPNKKAPVVDKIFQISESNLTYYYQINSTAILPTTDYTISVNPYNGQDGRPASVSTQSPPDLPMLTSEPEFNICNVSISTTLNLNNLRGQSKSYRLFVLKSDENSNLQSFQELEEFDLRNLRVVIVCNVSSVQYMLRIGQNQNNTDCEDQSNSALDPGTTYNITVIVMNTFNSIKRSNIYTYNYRTTGEPKSGINSSLFGLLALLLIIPLVVILYKKRQHLTPKENLSKQITYSTEVLGIEEDQFLVTNNPNTLQASSQKQSTNFSKPIKVTKLEEYVKESIANGELERQHAMFAKGQIKSCDCGALKENKPKNRYNNLIAYDHSRVVLEKTGDPHSDYINANYINGYRISKAYIATQGPTAATLDDFWRMIWQENVQCIANLANIHERGKKKVEKYWPEINETLKFGNVTVQQVSRKVYVDYEHRVFAVTRNEESRKVEQLHFSSWPDHGVPLYSQSLVPFLQKLLQVPLSTKSPIVVHCSAGVGRTGTILLCHISLRMAARESTIDLLKILQSLREARPNMVDNIEQYKLAHFVVLECLMGWHTGIPCNELNEAVPKLLRNSTLTSQMKYLKDTQWQDQAMNSVAYRGEEVPVVPEKNRFENIIPEIQGRVFLDGCPLSDEAYINAVKVDGRFIVTQQPLPTTLGDFWRLIDENSTSTSVILSLNEINPLDKTTCQFWPNATDPEMNPTPDITLKHCTSQILKHHDVTVVHLTSESRKDILPVQILSLKKWPPLTACPKMVEDFLAFWAEADSVARGTGRVFVTCYDGVTASGLFLALSFVIEKMKLEQVCDVCQAVRTVRHNRQQFVQDLEQFEFLYNAAALYINTFE